MEKLAKLIREFRERKGWTQAQMADAIGYSPPAVGKMERGEIRKPNNLGVIARVLEIPLDELLMIMSDDEAQSIAEQPAHSTVFKPKITPGTRQGESKTLPLYAAAMGGNGHEIVTFDPIDYVPRPADLEHVKDAYAILIEGDSMEPAYTAGDIAHVNPHKPIMTGEDYIFFRERPHGEADAMIKRLIGRSLDEWHLKQFNPAKEFSVSKSEWSICHMVVGMRKSRA